MKALFLYAEVTGYLMACLRALKAHPAVTDVRVYQALDLPETGYDFGEADISVFDAIGRSADVLWEEIAAFSPDLVYVSGWAFPQYLKLARRLRAQGVTTIIGNDTPWYGTGRQWLGTLVSPFWLRPAFDWMWVPGAAQHRFARRLSFPPSRIATGLLSADVAAFRGVASAKRPGGRKVLVSAGSFLPNKGMDRIQRAFESLLAHDVSADWDLLLVGATQPAASHDGRIRIVPFVQPRDMPSVFAGADAFILASQRESWGVVVHEAAAAGLPMVLSERAGSVEAFLHPGSNGWTFDPFSENDLRAKMLTLFQTPQPVLEAMSRHSEALAAQHTPEAWAQKLVDMHGENKRGSRS